MQALAAPGLRLVSLGGDRARTYDSRDDASMHAVTPPSSMTYSKGELAQMACIDLGVSQAKKNSELTTPAFREHIPSTYMKTRSSSRKRNSLPTEVKNIA